MDKKITHLQMIQEVIARMGQNSLTLKELCVGLVSALLALTVGKTGALVALLPPLVFWWLDGYFVCVERRYRDLFDYVRGQDEVNIDFCMTPTKVLLKLPTTWQTLRSSAIWPFYLSIVLGVVGFLFFRVGS